MSTPIYYLIHLTACRDAAPWRLYFTVPEGAQRTSSWKAFWQRIHVSISRCVVQVENIMLSFLFPVKKQDFPLPPGQEKLFEEVFLTFSGSQSWPRRTVGVFVWSHWSGTWTGPLSGPLLFSANRKAQVQAQLSQAPLSQASFEREQEKERDLLSDSLTAWEVMGWPGEKAAFRTPDLHLSPLTPRV